MTKPAREALLQWALFAATVGAAVGLGLAVVVSPWIADPAVPSLWTLYADDATVRRTSLFAALGLAATAFVFFKPRAASPKPTKPDAGTTLPERDSPPSLRTNRK